MDLRLRCVENFVSGKRLYTICSDLKYKCTGFNRKSKKYFAFQEELQGVRVEFRI
jgi:hypothetical protein